jgi:hypothetical protein
MLNPPGVDIVSLVRLVSDLNAKSMPKVTTSPTMVSTGVGTSPTMVSTGVSTSPTMDLSPLIKRIATVKSVPKVDASVGTTQRTTPYKSGFMSILPEVQRAAAISERAIASKTFTETKGTGTRTLTVPQVEALLEQGQIIRPPGGRLPAGERQARELAQAAQAAATEAEGNRPPM